MVFNPLYKQAENIPVILSIDLGFIEKSAKSSQFKKPEQIFKYSTELEEKIIREYEKRNPPEPSKPKFDSVLKPTVAPPAKTSPPPAVRKIESVKIDEFDPAATPHSPWDVPTTVKDDIDELQQALEQTRISSAKPPPTPSSTLAQKNYTGIAGNLIPEASTSDKTLLAVAIEQAEKMGLQEMDALRGFYLFQETPAELATYLDNYATLSELGFEQEKIDMALLTCKNKKEQALEELMKA